MTWYKDRFAAGPIELQEAPSVREGRTYVVSTGSGEPLLLIINVVGWHASGQLPSPTMQHQRMRQVWAGRESLAAFF